MQSSYLLRINICQASTGPFADDSVRLAHVRKLVPNLGRRQHVAHRRRRFLPLHVVQIVVVCQQRDNLHWNPILWQIFSARGCLRHAYVDIRWMLSCFRVCEKLQHDCAPDSCLMDDVC